MGLEGSVSNGVERGNECEAVGRVGEESDVPSLNKIITAINVK